MNKLEELKKLKAEHETAYKNYCAALDNGRSEIAKRSASMALKVTHHDIMSAIDKSIIMLAINNYAWIINKSVDAVDGFELDRRRSAAYRSI